MSDRDFSRLLTSAELRLGRSDVKEIMDHPFFSPDVFEDIGFSEYPVLC